MDRIQLIRQQQQAKAETDERESRTKQMQALADVEERERKATERIRNLRMLKAAHLNFSEKMWQRLEEKEKQGVTGWDNAEALPDAEVVDRILDKVIRKENKDLVDIANYAMMLWWRNWAKEGGGK